nr:10126_t:CDS:2 [Entrophospora candida]
MYKVSEDDRQKAHELVKSLYNIKKPTGMTRRTKSVKKTDYVHEPSGLTISSWRMNEWDYKKGLVPIMARGLFTRKTEEEKYEIVIRGYNKFFNIDETEDTKWENIESNTESPYELTIKENGCIIFIGGLPGGYLLTTSKHSLGIKQEGVSVHAIKGKEWVEKHLAKAGKSQTDLATFLYENKLTAVAELCDDSFEEHVLPYPPEMINEFAKEWGFIPTHYIMKKNVEEIKEFTNEIGKDGHYDGRAIEGFVVRTKYKSTGECFFFKVKYEEPYLMYRELREVTKAIINGKPPRFKYKLTQEYNDWVKEKLKTEPDIFNGYLKNQGIFRIREMFLNDLKLTGDALNSDKLAKLDNDQINKELKKTLIITVASIGCGKTSLSTALTKLFGFGHVQNDDKKRRLNFYNDINKLLETNEHRKSLIESVKSAHQNLSIIALYWDHNLEDLKGVFEINSKRVIERGEHHQTLRPENPHFKKIMWSFLESFEPLNSNNGVDDQYDLVIDLDISNDLKSNIKITKDQLKTILEIKEPSEEEIDNAIEKALQYESTVRKIRNKKNP